VRWDFGCFGLRVCFVSVIVDFLGVWEFVGICGNLWYLVFFSLFFVCFGGFSCVWCYFDFCVLGYLGLV